MKKILYSTYTKILIYVLCSFCFFQAFTTGLSGVIEYDNYKTEIFHFEGDFENSYFLSNVINSAAYELYIKTAKYIYDNSFDIEAYFENNMDSDHMDYKLVIDDKVIGNMTNSQANHKYYYKLIVQDKQVIEKEVNPPADYHAIIASQFDDSKIEIYVGLKDSYIQTLEDLWHEQKGLVNGTIQNVLYWSIAMFVCVVYLLVVAGKDESGNKKRYWIDHLYIEFNLAITAFLVATGIFVFIECVDQYMRGYLYVELFKLYSQLTAILVFNILLNSLLSIVRNLKVMKPTYLYQHNQGENH